MANGDELSTTGQEHLHEQCHECRDLRAGDGQDSTKVKLQGPVLGESNARRPGTAANAQRIEGGAQQVRRGRTQHLEPYGSV